MEKGLFIVVEGGEGCGKGTQIRRLKWYLETKGKEVVIVRDPGQTSAGEEIRNILLHSKSPMLSNTQMLLYTAARNQMQEEIIKPALAEGKIVLSDRFDLSTYVYQVNAQGASSDLFEALKGFVLRPHLELYLDVDDVEVALERARKSSGKYDRFESKNLDFHHKIRDTYRGSWAKLVPSGTIEEVWENVKKEIDFFLDNEGNN
ncbi:dTMP kinase [archaeon]|jgi:dTMP kinase|nr:dTMP kinase [archaeon]MBT4396730.1 dTMP kinase [archaeon]MBT4441340.1 dTMP kinase [archaeon]